MEVQPAQMSEFNKIITEPDSRKRAIKLKDCANAYKYLNDYYYYLGMAYYEVLDEIQYAVEDQSALSHPVKLKQ